MGMKMSKWKIFSFLVNYQGAHKDFLYVYIDSNKKQQRHNSDTTS